MKFKPTVLALAVSGALTVIGQADAMAEDETILKAVRTTASQENETDPQNRTELGRLNEFTPLAGSVVKREEVENLHFVDSLAELMQRVPGVSASRNLRFVDGGKNYTENRIDGMRARNTGTYSFVDSVNAGDIERIEIIRGPGSVLSGSNAIGGTINVITREPPKEKEYTLTQEFFEYEGYRSSLTGGDSVSDTLGYFFNVNTTDNPGWRARSAEKKDSFSTKWVWRPDDATKVAFRYEYLHDDAQDPGSLTSQAAFNANWAQPQSASYFNRTDVVYSTPSLHVQRLVGENGELNLFAQTRGTDQVGKSSTTYGGGGGGTSAITNVESTENNVQLMYKHNLSLAKSSVIVGMDRGNTKSRSIKYTDLSPNDFQFIRGTKTGDSITYETYNSPFAQYEFSPLDKLRLNYGVRQDQIRLQIDDQMNDTKDGRKSYGKTVAKMGAVYELSPATLIWANIGEGFLAPSVSTLLGSNTATPVSHAAAVTAKYVPTNMDLKPESSLTREIGIRGTLAGGLHYDTTYYETDFKDLQVSQLCGSTELCYTKNVNAARAHARGFETELTYPLAAQWDVALAHTYSKYQYDNYVTATTNYSGKERYWTPRNHYNFRVSYKPTPQWRAELEMDKMDSYFTNGTNTDSYQRPDLFNFRLMYHPNKTWSAWLQILNLTDQKFAFKIGADDTTGVKNSFATPYYPMTVRVGVSYKF